MTINDLSANKSIDKLEQEIAELKHDKQLQSALFQISELAHEELDLAKLYPRVHQIVEQLLDAKNFFIALYDEDQQQIMFTYFVDEFDVDDRDMTGRSMPIGKGLSSYVFRTRKAQLLDHDKINELKKQGEIEDVVGSADFTCWMGAPMISGNSLHGLIVIQTYQSAVGYDEQDLKLLDFVAGQVAAVIENTTNAQQRREAQIKLAEQHRILEQQNFDLSNTINRLEKTQDELVQKEKMASLGSLVAGIAHEINTPLGICVTGVSHLSEEYQTIKSSFENGSLTQSDLEDFFEEVESSLAIISTNIRRGAELVKSFKQVAVDQSSDEMREINVKHYLNEILLSLKPKLKRTKHSIAIECPENLVINVNAGAISQILSNLIINSLIHGFAEKEQGKIQIMVSIKDSNIMLRYADNGKGINQDDLQQLFEPFFTTKRGDGGSGLGAHLIYNLVTGVLGGKITVQSEINKGLAYLIKFPVKS